jgi:hypothetical protein
VRTIGEEEEAPTEEQAIAESEERDSEETRTSERDDFDLSDYYPDDDTPDYKLR